MVTLVVIMLLIHLVTKAQGYITCEENKICDFKFTVLESSNRIKTLLLKTNVHDVSNCYLGDTCLTYPNFRGYATPSIAINGDNITLSVTLSNINRERLKSDGNIWSAVAYFSDGAYKVIFNSTLQIIAKPKQLTCAYITSITGLLIDCLGSKSYPESKCNFTLKVNEVEIGMNNIPEYNHTQLLENDEYIITRCSLNIPMQNVTAGHYEFDIRIFPRTSDIACDDCGNTTITLDIEKPKVELIRCSTHVFQGTRLDCICTKSDSSDLASQVTWYQGNSILQQGENISVLTTTVSKAHNYTCQSENAFGWTSNKEIYIPNIISKKDIEPLKCSDNKPYSCLPHGICYGDGEFCYNGQVESCSPFNLSSVTFKKWCETQGHLKRNGSCSLACDTRVGLPEKEDQTTLISTSVVTVIAVLVVLIVLIIICWKNDLLTKKLFKSRKMKPPLGKDYDENQANASFAALELEWFLPKSTDKDDIHSAKKEWDICKRKSNHKGLILCTEYLKNPKAYLPEYDQGTVKSYINTCINLTVRLDVKSVSKERPVNTFGVQKDHALTGSGIIVAVELSETYHHVEHHDQTEKQTWSVYIATATQVVFDQTEAECTITELFYDDEQKNRVKKLQAIGIHQYNKDESCIIHCITDEENVYRSLKENLRQQKDQYKDLPSNGKKVVVISHPHGLPKHISFGELKEVCTDSSTSMFNLSRWKYTAAACHGSEGAPVLMLNKSQKKFSKQLIADFHVHSGVNADGDNFSASAPLPKKIAVKMLSQALQDASIDCDELISSEKKRKGQGHHSYETCSVDVLSSNMSRCHKNPGHSDFIQVKFFTIDNLPEGYQETTVYHYIQTLINLTGKLRVNYSDPDRSQFYPTTAGPILTSQLRFGTGTVVSVAKVKGQGTCPCPECKRSAIQKNVFYLIFVRTTKHIIHNDEEAQQSRFQIMFNEDTSSELNLFGLRVIESNIQCDRSLVVYTTHELQVGDMLAKTLRQLYTLDKQIVSKFGSSDDHKLAVIVSYPHGTSKCVSIGQWLKRKFVFFPPDHVYTQYTYNTATCPGCAGAPVFILAEGTRRVVQRLLTTHVHKETSDDCNTSCYGVESYRI